MKVADMTVEQLADLIRSIVAEELAAWQDDEGEMRTEFVAEMRQSMASGERGVPLSEVMKELSSRA